jgi:release factor glutamine methyltransferase
MASKNGEYMHVLTKLEKIKKGDIKSYKIKIFGKVVPVLPSVHSPKHFSDLVWFAKKVPRRVGRRSFLEIGTGTGIIALFVALGGATEILTTDINPTAVKNARRTFRLNSLRIPVRCGDVFKPIRPDEKFDVIFWNHPFFSSPTKINDMLLRGAFDHNYEGLRAFFRGAKKHLTFGGEILLGTGKIARINEIKKIARENGYIYTLVEREVISSKNRKGVLMEARLYSFKAKK